MKNLIKFIGLFFYLSFNAQSSEFYAKVISVKDGDTFGIIHKNEKYTLRLAHIDSPEKKQYFDEEAKQYASKLCLGKIVKIKTNGKKDRYKRIIGEVFIKNLNVNKELVKKGMAWHFKKYSKNKEYAQIEDFAKKRKIGLWKKKNPISPWEWRKIKKKKKY